MEVRGFDPLPAYASRLGEWSKLRPCGGRDAGSNPAPGLPRDGERKPMVTYIQAICDDEKAEELKQKKPDNATWLDVIDAGIDALAENKTND